MCFWNKKNEVETEALPEIRKEAFVDEKEPSSIPNKTAKKRMPITIIYDRLQTDYEAQGYKDAIRNPDLAYKDGYIVLMKSKLKLLIREVRVIYNDELCNIEADIKSLSEAGLVNTIDSLNAMKQKLTLHLETIIQMEADLEADKDYMTGIFQSYERGFLNGLADRTMESLKYFE
jgi:hypothetical protein